MAGLLIDPFLSYLVHERFELGLVDLGDLEGEEADGGGLADLAALGRGGNAARHHVQGLEAAEKKCQNNRTRKNETKMLIKITNKKSIQYY